MAPKGEQTPATDDVPFVAIETDSSFDAKKKDNESQIIEAPDAKFTPSLIAAWMISLLGPFHFGYNVGVCGAVTEDAVFPGHSSLSWSVMVAIFSIGGLIGALCAGPIGGNWPRRRAILAMAVLYIIAGLLMMFAADIIMLIVGRFVVGLAAGTTSVFVPLYHRELSGPNLRGTLGTGYQVACTLGILSADAIAFALAGKYHSVAKPGWRLFMGMSSIIGVLQILLLPLLPESPSWLVSSNQTEAATTTLKRLRGVDDVETEILSIRQGLEKQAEEQQESVGVREVLRDRSIRRPLVIGCTLQVMQQFSGINAVMFYANKFFENAGLENPQVGTVLVGAVNFLSTIVALVLMDRAGRRPLLIWSGAGQLVSQIILTLALLGVIPASTTISVIGMLCFVAFFEFGFGPIPWLITGDVMPPAPRAAAMSVAMVYQWFFTFVIGLIYPAMQSGLDKYSFVPFSVCLLLSLIFTLRFIPETKGKSVEEIHAEMEKCK